jgi:hypothetical protein
MLGSSWVTAQLAASQEMFSSVSKYWNSSATQKLWISCDLNTTRPKQLLKNRVTMPSEGVRTHYSLLALVSNPTPQHVSIKWDKNRGVLTGIQAGRQVTGSHISVGYTASLSSIKPIYMYECLLPACLSFFRKASTSTVSYCVYIKSTGTISPFTHEATKECSATRSKYSNIYEVGADKS